MASISVLVVGGHPSVELGGRVIAEIKGWVWDTPTLREGVTEG